MKAPRFFNWSSDAQVVYGAYRAAVYDLGTENVFSLNEAARLVAEQIEHRTPLSAMSPKSVAFVYQLAQQGFGQVGDSPRPFANGCQASLSSMPLRFLSLEVTSSCNQRCIHCYGCSGTQESTEGCAASSTKERYALPFSHLPGATDEPSDPEGDMREADWLRLIRDAASLGCDHLQIIGGEPLLYRPLPALIEQAKEAGFPHIELFTNGTLVTEDIAEFLAARGVEVAVSLHGSSPEVQDRIAQRQGSFRRTYEGLRLLQEHKIPTRLATTALMQNQNDLSALADLATGLHLRSYSYDIVRPIGRARSSDLLPDDVAVLSPKWVLEPDFFTSRESYLRNRLWHSCWAGRLAVTSAGDAIPCVFSRGQVVGNLLDTSLVNILASQRLQELWSLTKDQIEICRDCEYRYACGDCRPLALSETGNMYAKYPRCTYDPYLGRWASLDGACRDSGQWRRGPKMTLAAKSTGSAARDHRTRYQCDPNGCWQGPEIALATNTSGSMYEQNQRYSCDPK